MAILTVGSGKTYSTIALAVAAVSSGDTIQIYSGTYNEHNITLHEDNITFECGTGEFEDVLLSGSDNASEYLIHSYAEEISWNNLTFTGYKYVPSRLGTNSSFSMSGCLVYNCGNAGDNTIRPGGDSGYTSVIESCKIFSLQGDAIGIYGDYVEVNNCLVVSDDDNDEVVNLGVSNLNTTASFCTIIGSNTGYLVTAAKVINCIVSGTALTETQPPPGSSNNYSGVKGISSDDSSYNIVIVDGGSYWTAGGTYRHTASATEKTLVAPYFTNPGVVGSSNYLTDDYSLVENKTVSEAIPTSYFTMEDGTGAELSDVSKAGNSRTGSLIDGVTWDGSNKKVGSYSLDFDGVDGYVILDQVPQDLAGSDFSVFFWIKTSVSNGGKIFAFQKSDLLPRFEINLWIQELYITPPNSTPFSPYVKISDNNWHHLGLTFNNTLNSARFYLDGNLHTFHSSSAGAIASDDTLRIGCNLGGGATPLNFFDGNIDELSFWDSALSEEQILFLYNKGEGMDANTLNCDTTFLNPAINAGVRYDGKTTDLPGLKRPETSGIIYTQKVLGIESGSMNRCLGVLNQSAPDVGAYEYATRMSKVKKVLDVSN